MTNQWVPHPSLLLARVGEALSAQEAQRCRELRHHLLILPAEKLQEGARRGAGVGRIVAQAVVNHFAGVDAADAEAKQRLVLPADFRNTLHFRAVTGWGELSHTRQDAP